MGTENLSRRTLAKGAAWSVPVIAVSAPAWAAAASRTVVGASICSLFYGSTTSVNYEVHSIYLGVTATDNLIPAGTTFTWTVTMSGSGNEVPTLNYSQNNSWTLSTSPAPGDVASSFTVTLRTNTAVSASSINCAPALVWNDIYSIKPATTVTISTKVTGTNLGGTTPSTLSYTVAKRTLTGINETGRRAHIYLSKSGGQTCYPTIRYTLNAASQKNSCGASGSINSTSTIYPDGSCAQIVSTAAQVGSQANIAQKC